MRLRLTVFAVLAALAAAGCGSTATPTATRPATSSRTETAAASEPIPTRAQFIAQADAICRRLRAEQAPLKARVAALQGLSERARSTFKTLASLLRQSIALARAADTRFAAIPRPVGDAATIDKLLAIHSEEVTEATNYANALDSYQRSAWEAAGAALTKAEAFDRGISQGYGMEVCGRE
jgi:hypothetical protein